MLNGKVILVVGGAAGIGRATAELCAARGAAVVVADIDPAAGKQVATAIGGLFVPVNVTDPASVQAMYAAIEERYGRLDGLIQTAGVLKGAYTPVDEFPLETWRTVMEVNVTGSFLCAKHAVPLLKKSDKGVIILVSSGAAVGGSSSVAYGASKGGVNSLGITLASEAGAGRHPRQRGDAGQHRHRHEALGDRRRGGEERQIAGRCRCGVEAGCAGGRGTGPHLVGQR